MGFIPAIGISAIMSIISAESISNGFDSSVKDVIGVSGLGVLIASVAGSMITSVQNYFEVKRESAKMVAGEFLDIPDYSTNLGFIHHVEGDLQKIFETIRNTEDSKYLPIVIFIDDLDRCSPEKIADVAEGINLFLAGEFEECIFILGIDAEIVAAALEIAHGDIISKLPGYSLSTPVGRRFMDKFVQLPITLPLPEKENIPLYVDSLLDEKYVNSNSSREKIEKLNQEIDSYSDKDPVIRKLIKEATSDFSDNPREMKRFMNAFRFQYFLWLTRKNRPGALKHLTKTQLQRWVTLSLKWPELVRWLQWYSRQGYSSDSVEENNQDAIGHKGLIILEETFGSDTDNDEEWKKVVAKKLGLDAAKAPWITDDSLRKFFREEIKNRSNPDRRLATSVGNGFY